MRRSSAFIFGLLLVVSPPALAREADQPATQIDWKSDLGHMVEQLRIRHPDPFHDVSEAEFVSRADALAARIDGLSDWQAAIELQRLLSLIREGHTGLGYLQPEFGVRGFPMRFQAFSDGIFVQAVPPSHKRLLGARLLAVGKTNVDHAERRISDILSADNEAGERRQLPFMLSVNIVLHALGLTADRDQATYVLERADGKTETITLRSLPVDEVGDMLEPGWEPPSGPSSTRLRDLASTPEPLWLKRAGDLYWHEYLPESRTLYAQVNRLYDRGKFDFETFTRSLFASYDEHRPERLVIDLRHNTGGDHIDLPFIHEILRRPALSERGRLFALIGPMTFSAAQTFVNHLEEHTNVIFVGEQTAQRPNMYGVVGRFSLPSSRLRVSHSRYYIQGVDPADFRLATEPHLPVGYSADDYAQNRDPVLQAAISYRAAHLPDLVQELRAAHESGGVSAALAAYKQVRPLFVAQGISTEPLVTRFANALLRTGKPSDALQVFRANAQVHPHSSIAFDALAEAALSAGRTDEAVVAARQALAINPANADASRVLRLAGMNPP